MTLSKLNPLDANATMARAYLLMERNSSPNLPVASDDQIVGVICERDIDALLRTYQASDGHVSQLKVGNFMRSPVKTVDLDADLGAIARMMLDERVNAVIIKRSGDVVGALTKDDLLHILCELLGNDQGNLLESLKSVKASFGKNAAKT